MTRANDHSAVMAVRERFLDHEGGEEPRKGPPGTLVHDSWRRSALFGVAPDRAELPYEPEFDTESPLMRAAAPVLDRLADRLGKTSTAVILADRRARIISRRVPEGDLRRHLDKVYAAEGFVYGEEVIGTNGLGTAVEVGRPVLIEGAEHYADRLVELTCAGAPIVNPVTKQVEGIIDVTCHVRRGSGLMLPLMEDAAREIEERLYLSRAVSERALMQQFLRAARCATHGVVAINERFVISNAGATRLLAGVDHGLLWEQAGRVVARQAVREKEISLPDDRTVAIRMTPLCDGGEPIGALLEIQPQRKERQRATPTGQPVRKGTRLPGLAGRNVHWLAACAVAAQAAAKSTPVVLRGEPGVGKASVATALHDLVRPGRPLSTVSAALSRAGEHDAWLRDVLDQVRNQPPGTLVVYGVHHLEPALVDGLRAIVAQAGRSGWQFVATATSESAEADQAGQLVDVLGGVHVTLPPLRHRLDDMAELVAALINRRAVAAEGRPREVAREVIQVFQRLIWPGNLHQLSTVVDRLMAANRSGVVRITDVPPEILKAAARRPLTRFERAEIHAVLGALAETGGNKREAAELLGISRSRLYRKLESVGIDLEHVTY